MKTGMRFEELSSGEAIFIDANIFIYHFTGKSRECYELIRRCELGELTGFSAQNILLEVLHRLMVLEALEKKIIRGPNPARKLREAPDKARQLSDYYYNTSLITQMGIQILSFPRDFLEKSQHIRARFGLLVNDSITVSIMKENNIASLATSDSDFTRVKGILVYMPSDI